jgi:hypothetical protein
MLRKAVAAADNVDVAVRVPVREAVAVRVGRRNESASRRLDFGTGSMCARVVFSLRIVAEATTTNPAKRVKRRMIDSYTIFLGLKIDPASVPELKPELECLQPIPISRLMTSRVLSWKTMRMDMYSFLKRRTPRPRFLTITSSYVALMKRMRGLILWRQRIGVAWLERRLNY